MGAETALLAGILGTGLAGTGIAAAGATGAFGEGSPDIRTIPLTRRARALQSIAARVLATNLGSVAPTFQEFVQSGGTATFPLVGTSLTPKEVKQLGLVSKQGGTIPIFDPAKQTALTPEQLIFLATESQRQGNDLGLSQLGTVSRRIERRERQGKPTASLEERREKLLRRLGVV